MKDKKMKFSFKFSDAVENKESAEAVAFIGILTTGLVLSLFIIFYYLRSDKIFEYKKPVSTECKILSKHIDEHSHPDSVIYIVAAEVPRIKRILNFRIDKAGFDTLQIGETITQQMSKRDLNKSTSWQNDTDVYEKPVSGFIHICIGFLIVISGIIALTYLFSVIDYTCDRAWSILANIFVVSLDLGILSSVTYILINTYW